MSLAQENPPFLNPFPSSEPSFLRNSSLDPVGEVHGLLVSSLPLQAGCALHRKKLGTGSTVFGNLQVVGSVCNVGFGQKLPSCHRGPHIACLVYEWDSSNFMSCKLFPSCWLLSPFLFLHYVWSEEMFFSIVQAFLSSSFNPYPSLLLSITLHFYFLWVAT